MAVVFWPPPPPNALAGAALLHPLVRRWIRQRLARGITYQMSVAELEANPPVVACWQFAEMVTSLHSLDEVRGFVDTEVDGRFLGVRALVAEYPWDPDGWTFIDLKDKRKAARLALRHHILKNRLGQEGSPLVDRAAKKTKAAFVKALTYAEDRHIDARLGVDAEEFWKLCRGHGEVPPPPQAGWDFSSAKISESYSDRPQETS